MFHSNISGVSYCIPDGFSGFRSFSNKEEIKSLTCRTYILVEKTVKEQIFDCMAKHVLKHRSLTPGWQTGTGLWPVSNQAAHSRR